MFVSLSMHSRKRAPIAQEGEVLRYLQNRFKEISTCGGLGSNPGAEFHFIANPQQNYYLSFDPCKFFISEYLSSLDVGQLKELYLEQKLLLKNIRSYVCVPEMHRTLVVDVFEPNTPKYYDEYLKSMVEFRNTISPRRESGGNLVDISFLGDESVQFLLRSNSKAPPKFSRFIQKS